MGRKQLPIKQILQMFGAISYNFDINCFNFLLFISFFGTNFRCCTLHSSGMNIEWYRPRLHFWLLLLKEMTLFGYSLLCYILCFCNCQSKTILTLPLARRGSHIFNKLHYTFLDSYLLVSPYCHSLFYRQNLKIILQEYSKIFQLCC